MKCQRCGLCCEGYNPFSKDHKGKCPHYVFDENTGKATCLLYNHPDRPQFCRGWPDNDTGRCFMEKPGINVKKTREKLRKVNL